MSATILQINFNFGGSWAEYEAGNAAGAAQIAGIPGLGWKIWLKNAATGEAGGIYLFHDATAAQGFATQVAGMLKEMPGISNISIKQFGVIESLTAITRGPLPRPPLLKFACKDAGVDCDYIASGETVDAVKENAFAHAGVVHAEILKSMSQEQLAELTRTVEANIKPA
jgi:predicted small metal-binding protein